MNNKNGKKKIKRKAVIKNGKEITNVPDAVGAGLAGDLKLKKGV